MSNGKILGINHISMRVGDVDKAAAFYTDCLGFKLLNRDEVNAALITPDGVILEITPGIGGGDLCGITHVCYNTYDVDKVYERALSFGATPSRGEDSAPSTYKNLRMAFVRTPAGEEIEFWGIRRADHSFGEEVKDGIYVKHFVHAALTVKNRQECIRFYEGLGAKLKVDWDTGCSMTLQDGRELELFDGEEDVTENSYNHVCLMTDDVFKAQELVLSLGGRMAHEPYDWSNLQIGFYTGLAGEVIEFFRMYDDGRKPDIFKEAPTPLPDIFSENLF